MCSLGRGVLWVAVASVVWCSACESAEVTAGTDVAAVEPDAVIDVSVSDDSTPDSAILDTATPLDGAVLDAAPEVSTVECVEPGAWGCECVTNGD